MYRELHYAKCLKCGYKLNHSERGDFISHFFLPSICKKCGDVKFRYGDDRWLHVIEIQKKIKYELSLKNPLSWFGCTYWYTVKKEEMKAG